MILGLREHAETTIWKLQEASLRKSQLLRKDMLITGSRHHLPLQYKLLAIGSHLQAENSSLHTAPWVWMHFWLVFILEAPCHHLAVFLSPLQAHDLVWCINHSTVVTNQVKIVQIKKGGKEHLHQLILAASLLQQRTCNKMQQN